MKNPYLKIILLIFILTLTFPLTTCIDSNWYNNDIEVEPIVITITFDANGGSGGPTTIDATFGEPMPSLSAVAPTHTILFFAGYYDAKTGGTMYYTADLKSSKNWDKKEDAVLYAQWTSKPEATIIFNSNYGSNEITTQTVELNVATALDANTFTRSGYTFTGWSLSSTGIVAYLDGANYTAGTVNVELYAQWTGNTYTITFNANEGMGGPTPTTRDVTYGSPMPNLSGQTPPTRVVYAFTGYYDAQTGGTKYYNANLTSAINWDKASDAILYAQWEEIEFEMVPISAGTFTMGSNDSADYGASPPHQVALTGFYMGKYQVTQEQYEAVMESNPSSFSSSPTAGEIQGKRPVEYVSWYDALVFCNKLSVIEGLTPAYIISSSTNPDDWGLVPTISDATWNAVGIVPGSTGYRLPTEAQWEYACRAGTITAWYHDDYEPGLENYAWYYVNSNSMTHEVGKKLPNAWGLYDMHGNVWEWCWDWWDNYDSGASPETDPLGASLGLFRVIRGGLWVDPAEDLRSAFRGHYYVPSLRSADIGFRLVRP
ncbi:MAG: SUMF1/EgtB/PvdO family nonheme iron enzyme [Leptospirales bacterium]|nr:SUMF1/EgtB/PvdO family nonheme iron enzyme [Leptospirales bacterium]